MPDHVAPPDTAQLQQQGDIDVDMEGAPVVKQVGKQRDRDASPVVANKKPEPVAVVGLDEPGARESAAEESVHVFDEGQEVPVNEDNNQESKLEHDFPDAHVPLEPVNAIELMPAEPAPPVASEAPGAMHG